jgi:hypothetical protein
MTDAVRLPTYYALYLIRFYLYLIYRGSLFNFDRKIAFWNFLAAGNYAGE